MSDAIHQPTHDGHSLGARLRAAREALGLSVLQAGERLHVPAAIIEAMERDDHERLGAAIFARGHLRSYAALVGVPAVAVDAALRADTTPPPLQPAVHVTHSRFLVDRYARRAVYAVLTASLVVPVLLATHGNLLRERNAALEPLDVPATSGEPPAPVALVPAERPADYPVVASMAPFYPRADARPAGPPAAVANGLGEAARPPAVDGERLVLELSSPSWVEVVAHDGRRLQYGLIEGGRSLSFAAGEVANVSLGDADAVSVRVDGETVDLSPYRRAKVARFKLSSEGEITSFGG